MKERLSTRTLRWITLVVAFSALALLSAGSEAQPPSGSASRRTADPAAAAEAARQRLLACAVACQDLEQQVSLVLEYEMCGAVEQIRAARNDRRILKMEPSEALSQGASCLRKELLETSLRSTVSYIIVPKSDKRRDPGYESLSGDLSALRACLAPIGREHKVPRAHRDLARAALVNTGYQSKGLIELASEQADYYEWLNPAAHAQTDNDPNVTRKDAIEKFKTHVTEVTGKIRSSCCKKDLRMVAYQLGYLFHAIQDLATHAGITNDHHAYLMPNGNPDLVKANLDRAQNWSLKTLKIYAKSPHAACARDASKVPAAGANWPALALAGGYGKEDGSKAEMAKFLFGALRLSAPADRSWFDQKNAGEADKFFDENVVSIVSQSVGSACDQR
jgi:hypothetical protein